MVRGEGLTLDGGHTVQYADPVTEKPTPDTYVTILINDISIHLIKKGKKRKLYNKNWKKNKIMTLWTKFLQTDANSLALLSEDLHFDNHTTRRSLRFNPKIAK